MLKTLIKILLLPGLALLAACSQPTPALPTSAPTADLNLLRTEVAATMMAQLAQTPSPTLPPTATLQPTATQEPAISPTAGVTETASTPVSSTGDQARWVAQSIADGTRFNPGESFTMTWTIQNVGKTTWTEGYRLRFYSGNNFGAPKEIQLGKEVAPDEMVDITVQMIAPTKVGKYRSDWVMSNESLFNFNQPVFLEIVVALPSTPTVTPTVVTPTSTPQELLPTETPKTTQTPST